MNRAKQILNQVQKLSSSKAFYRLSILVGIAMCFVYAYALAQSVDFYPINGAFQNFNVVRRVLNGQDPYADFTVYLGLGHLVFGSLTTWVFGGDFQASIFAFYLLTGLASLLLLYTLCRSITGRNGLCAVPAVLFMVFYGAKGHFGPSWMVNALGQSMNVGNSARAIRGAALPVLLTLAMASILFAKRRLQRRMCKPQRCNDVYSLLIAIASGISLIWSNDYGVVSWVSILFVTTVAMGMRERTVLAAIRSLAVQLVGVCGSVFVFASLATKGHFGLWLRTNFFLAGYQDWYFNFAEDKAYYWYNLDYGILPMLCLLLFVVYFILLLRAKADDHACVRYGVPAVANLAFFGAIEGYALCGGGGAPLHNYASFGVWVVVSMELLQILWNRLLSTDPKHAKDIPSMARLCVVNGVLVVVLFGCAIGSLMQRTRMLSDASRTKQRMEVLGGPLPTQHQNVANAIDYLQGKTIFSEYSSAIEACTGQFQPSGTDYVIHVLSDEARAHYLDAFHKESFDAVMTMYMPLDLYDDWIRSANWFFRREVYRSYHPVWLNGYGCFWEKNEEGVSNAYTEDITVSTTRLSEQSIAISLEMPASVNGIADVWVDYSTKTKHSLRAKLIRSRIVSAYETEDCQWCLRPESAEYIPIRVINGKGSITLTSYPMQDTALTLNDVQCDAVYQSYQAECLMYDVAGPYLPNIS